MNSAEKQSSKRIITGEKISLRAQHESISPLNPYGITLHK